MGIEQKGIIDAATSQLMRQTAYNDINKEYGIGLIKQGPPYLQGYICQRSKNLLMKELVVTTGLRLEWKQ